ncbi:MAG: MBL fold metallo-hydrolase RNA specificity domain-containing protein [Bacillota bacterium]
MKITFYGAARTTTGACYLVDTGEQRLLIDCGLFQGAKNIKERNYGSFPFDPGSIDFLLLTHAHIDHSGLIPKLYKHGYQGPVICTSATFELCSVLLQDSGYIQEMEVERKNRKLRRSGQPLLEPIYTSLDAQNCLKYFHPINYDEFWEIYPGITIRFRDAGHILGSSIIELWIASKEGNCKFVFSGDLGNKDQPLVNDPTPIDFADFLIIESTYGARHHSEKIDRLEALKQVIHETFQKGGNLIIPAFAVERTQDLLYDLHRLIERGDIKGQDIYIDSPLAISATEIFCRNYDYFDAEATELRRSKGGTCPLYLPGLRFCRTVEESIALNKIQSGAIIISASGMADAGRIKHHLKHNLWRPESTVLFVGFQAEGTLGRRLLEGEKIVRIHGEEIMVKADIRNLDGFSAHADQTGLLKWAKQFKVPPRKIFITHGEEKGSIALAGILAEHLNTEVIVPHWLEEFDLTGDLRKEIPLETEINAEVLRQLSQQVQEKLNRLIAGDIDMEKSCEIFNLLKRLQSELNEVS